MYDARFGDPARHPLAYYRAYGMQALADLIRERTGYVCQRGPLVALVECLETETPLLAEGKRGSGKSALGEALAEAFGLTLFRLQGMSGLRLADILYEWDREEQRHLSRAEKWTRAALHLGAVAAAFEHAETVDENVILILDELDKIDEPRQYTLLQVLQNGFIDVPRLEPPSRVGVVSAGRAWPIVYATSNDQKEKICEPLRSRFGYTWIEPPTPFEEIGIMIARVPEADPELLRVVVKMMDFIRHMGGVRDKPALREMIKLLGALSRKGVAEMSEAVIERHVVHFGKRQTDVANILQAAKRISDAANRYNPLDDPMIDEAFRAATSRAAEAVA